MTALSLMTNDGARLHIRRPFSDRGHAGPSGAPAGRLTGETGRGAVRAATGKAVLMLHSLFFDGSMFDELVRHLVSDASLDLPSAAPLSTLDFYAPDHRGQGRSEPGRQSPSIERLADDVIAMIETVVGEPVHLFGSSMGGYVALRILQQRPELLASCVLSCCTAHAERQPERFAALESRIRTEGTGAMGQNLSETMFGERFVADDGPVLRRWRQHFASLDRSVADAVHGVFARPGYEAVLPGINTPLLLFSGALDRAKRPADMDFIAQRVPHSTHRVVADAGHTPPVENPAYVAAELKRFWRQCRPDIFGIERSKSNVNAED